MTKEIKLEADVIGMLSLQRNSTYKDPASFLDEVIQNADRAGATEVRISTSWIDREVRIFNNGAILEDPQVLFSMGKSNWSEQVTQTENPFGMGFFSNVSVSDHIIVESGNKRIDFNVNDALQNRKLEIPEIEMETPVEGFNLILKNFDFNKVSPSAIAARAEALGKYIHKLDIYYNDELMEKKDLFVTNGSPYAESITENDKFIGWVALSRGFMGRIKLFNQGRFVMELTDLYYAEGELHLKPGTLNLVAPDRKDVIRDNKYREFLNDVNGIIGKIALRAVEEGDRDLIDQYESALRLWVDVDKAKKVAKFQVFVGNDKSHMSILDSIILNKAKLDNGKTFGIFDTDAEAYIQPTVLQNTAELTTSTEIEEKDQYGPIKSTSKPNYNTLGVHHEALQDDLDEDIIREQMEHIIAGGPLVFWVKEEDLTKYDKKLRLIKYYGLRLVIAYNDLDTEILKAMERDSNVVHLSTLEEKIEVQATLSNRVLSLKEERALSLLDMVSRLSGFKSNVFEIGDLIVTTRTSIPQIDAFHERIEEDVVAIRSEDGTIFTDRTMLHIDMLDEFGPNDLTLNDYKFILANLHDLVAELILLKQAHNNAQVVREELIQKILHGLAFN